MAPSTNLGWGIHQQMQETEGTTSGAFQKDGFFRDQKISAKSRNKMHYQTQNTPQARPTSKKLLGQARLKEQAKPT